MKSSTKAYVILMAVLWAGFNHPVAMADQDSDNQQMPVETPGLRSPEPVEDKSSAITILKSESQPLPVTHDPFAPLVMSPKTVVDTHVPEQQQENDLLMGMRYLGMVKFGEIFTALLHTENGRGVYQVNDQVNGLTITAIDEGFITFTKGNKTLKLQRGDL